MRAVFWLLREGYSDISTRLLVTMTSARPRAWEGNADRRLFERKDTRPRSTCSLARLEPPSHAALGLGARAQALECMANARAARRSWQETRSGLNTLSDAPCPNRWPASNARWVATGGCRTSTLSREAPAREPPRLRKARPARRHRVAQGIRAVDDGG